MSATPVRTRKLGRTNVSVSELGIGTAPLGDLFDQVEDEEAAWLFAAAWDGGVRYFDTSPWYGRGQAEHRLGRALYRRKREDVVISTKVGRVLRRPLKPGPFDRGDWIGGLDFEIVFDYGYDGVMRSFEDSLQRLGINRVDLLLVHDLDGWHHKSPAKVDAYFDQLFLSGWRALCELRDQGVINGIGAGVNMMGSIPRFLDLFDIDFFLLAMRYTLLETDVLDSEFPRCAERGVGIVIGGGYNSGILATGAVPGRDVQLRARGPRRFRAGGEDRARLRPPQRPDRGGGAAVPARASDRRLDRSRRDFGRPGRAEPRRLPAHDPRGPVGGAQARKPSPRRCADAGVRSASPRTRTSGEPPLAPA